MVRNGVFRKARSLHDHAGGSIGDSAELHSTFSDQVDVFLNILVNLVEQFVKVDEIRALHVPVCVLALSLQVDSIRESCIAELDDFRPGCFGEIIFRWVHSFASMKIQVSGSSPSGRPARRQRQDLCPSSAEEGHMTTLEKLELPFLSFTSRHSS